MKGLISAENALNLLLVFVPVALVLEFVTHASGTAVFVTSAIAVIPLAGRGVFLPGGLANAQLLPLSPIGP